MLESLLCLIKACCRFLMDHFNLFVIQGLSELLILTVLHGNKSSIAPFNSEEKSWNFSLHEAGSRTWVQSFSNIHIPKGRQALSLISLTRTTYTYTYKIELIKNKQRKLFHLFSAHNEVQRKSWNGKGENILVSR